MLLVLVLLMVLSLALGAMFAQAGANLRTSTVVAIQDNKVYAADGGIEIAIQKLRAMTTCPSSLDPETTIDGLTITITLSCPNYPGNITITAMANPPAGGSGGTAITSVADVSIGPPPSRAVNVNSWVTVVQ